MEVTLSSTTDMIAPDELLSVGTIGRNSWRKILGQLGDAEWLVLMIDNIPVPWRANEFNQELAIRYAGCEAYMLRRECDDTDADEDDLTWDDLIGYTVINCGEGEIGHVERVDEQTINTLLYLDSGRIVPAHEDLILSLDLDEKQLIMNLPLGL